MKIIICVHNLTGGGAERVAALWATGFAERGHEVAVVLNCRKGTPVTYGVPGSVRTYNLYGNEKVGWAACRLHRRLHLDAYFVSRLRKVLQDFRPDVVIGVLQPWAEWARKAARGMNIAIVNTEHNSFGRPASAPLTRAEHRRKFEWNKRYAQVTVLTQADKAVVGRLLDNVTVLPNPLAFQPVESVPPKEKVFLAAGRLDAGHTKGFDVLIKAFGMTSNDWPLQILGAGHPESVARYRALAQECGVGDRVQFLGYAGDPLPLYRRASVFVLSSRYEGFGMVLIEAMSQGCAPIACDYKGRQREIITSGEEGIVCPVDDAEALARAMDQMAGEEEYRRRVQRNAVARSAFYSLDHIMDRWEEILKRVLTGKQPTLCN